MLFRSWVRADNVTGSPVSQMNAMPTTTVNMAQSVGANRPTLNASDADFNGCPSLSFDTTDYFDSDATISAGDFTIIWVGKYSAANFVYERALGVGYAYAGTNQSLQVVGGGGASSKNLSPNWLNGSTTTFRHRFAGTHASNRLWKNGTEQVLSDGTGGTGDPSSATLGGVTFSWNAYSGGSCSAHKLAELMFFNRALTDAEAEIGRAHV